MSMKINIRREKSLSSGSGLRLKRTSVRGRVLGFLFGIPFFAAGLLFFWVGGAQPLLNVYNSQGWPEMPCVITLSTLETNRDSDGNTYKVHIEFSYQYEGRKYEGGSYNFSDFSSSGKSSKQEIIRQYPPGQHFSCWVNPEDPKVAVLQRNIPGIVYFIIPFSSIFILVGGAIMLGSLGFVPKKWKQKNHGSDATEDVYESRGAQILKPKFGGSLGKLIGAFIFACFWNGIVSVFVVQAYRGFERDQTEWGLVLFLIPFVAIGLFLIGMVIYYLLALTNPKIQLHINEASPRLGDTVSLTWSSSGSIGRLHTLEFFLEGEESATYRRGTDTVTDTCIFYRKTLLSTSEPTSMMGQSIEIHIPLNLIHSFKSDNNKINWHIRIAGDIRKWPDLKETFPIFVRPIQIK